MLCSTLASILLVTSYSVAAQSSTQRKRISPMTASDNAQNQRQRSIINKLVQDHFGYVRLSGSTADLYYIQRILDKGLIPKNATYDLQSLGVIFGDVMAKSLSLQWVIVQDRYGRSRALRYADSDSLFYPLTMISRRFQNNLAVNVRQLYKGKESTVNGLIYKKGKYKTLPTS